MLAHPFWKNHDIALDLGTSVYSLSSRSQSSISKIPAYIAWRGDELNDRSLVAVGEDARQLLLEQKSERGSLRVCRPMSGGVVQHSLAAFYLLKALWKRAGLHWSPFGGSMLVTTVMGGTASDRATFLELAQSLRRGRIVAFEEPLAAANSLPIHLEEPYAQLIVDVGAGITEAVVLVGGQKVAGRSLAIAGDAFDRRIQEEARRRHGLYLNPEEARSWKEGRDRGSRLSAGGDQAQAWIKAALHPQFEQIAHELSLMIEELPQALAAELIENGLHLCGGSARMSGLAECISLRTGLKVQIPAEPEDAVIRGSQRLLGYLAHWP